ncbi:MAG TPA: HD domain-containing phosphohydrolase [Pirellulales bacterium]|jgi:putative two-component system response regulator|nr:HD domain-containing phosphohydrolase [Pirellulales bacterium]
MRVLIVEDDPDALELLEHALTCFGYEVATATNGFEALEKVRTGNYRVVVSDWEMPGLTGLELCHEVRQRIAFGYTYFILLTSRASVEDLVDSLRNGADEFLSKPFNPVELDVRLRVAERILSLESRDLVIFSLAKLAEARDPETGAHLERIREYCLAIARQLCTLEKFRDHIDGDYAQTLYLTSPLHDIGKVGIPDRILLKPGALTPEEFEVMKQHTIIGGETLAAAAAAHPGAKFLQVARDIALSHHEKYNGTGYPFGLKADNIPLCGRIVALADVYDALTTARVYKPAYSHDVARSIILEGRGKHFDPDIVEAFLTSEQEFVAIHHRLGGFEAAGEPTAAVARAERALAGT